MADRQRKIPPAQKRQLIAEAGGKCANPGCANWRQHVHHIKHWAVYKTHDSADMIAICPSCHDEIHHGRMKITDDVLYAWKGIKRSAATTVAHVYVEPSTKLRLLAGSSIAFTTEANRVTVFELSNHNQLSLRVLDGDILKVNSSLQNRIGKEIVRVVENHVRVLKDDNISFEFHAGRARITVPASEDYIAPWVIEQVRQKAVPDFAMDGRVVAFDLQVVRPGVVRVEGYWSDADWAIVFTSEYIVLCRQVWHAPCLIGAYGEGKPPLLVLDGPLTRGILGFP